jgi:hypothetical protein
MQNGIPAIPKRVYSSPARAVTNSPNVGLNSLVGGRWETEIPSRATRRIRPLPRLAWVLGRKRTFHGQTHSNARHAVQIEPGLQPQSPRNGNISNIRRRLSAISPWKRPNLESGDRPQIRKSPPLAGISGITEGKISWRRTGWLALQCRSHPSPRDFPGIREFYREFRDSRA